MAVAPTGAIYKALEFDGVSSRTYGVYITGEAVYNAPERDVEMVTIPGRNGTYALDNGRFENIEVSYPAGIFAETETDFRQAISEFRNFLCSRKGYVRLQDEYNPDEYRLAVYKSGLEVEPAMLKAGEFKITFDCKPQRWLTSGETAITIGEWRDTETVSGDIVEVENPDEILGVKSLSVALSPIQDLHGYDKPWVGGAGKNKFDGAIESGALDPSNGQKIADSERYRSANFIKVQPNTAYALSVNGTLQSANIYSYGSDKSFLSDVARPYASTFTTSADTHYIMFFGTSALNSDKVQLESGSTASSWTPYSNICPISGRTEVVTWDDPKYGGTVAWNQLLDLSYSITQGGITRSAVDTNGKTTITGTKTGAGWKSWANIDYLANHKVLVLANNLVYTSPEKTSGLAVLDNFSQNYSFYQNAPYCIFTKNADTTLRLASGGVVDDVFDISGKFQLFDLTQMFGSTIADYIHSLEQANAGDGVAYFRNLFPNDYYEYNAGETTCVSAVNGDPYNHYTTALGRTVYGGTLDVVSGVLTVDRAMVTYDGSSDESWTGANTRFAIIPPNVYASGSGRGEVLSNEFMYSPSETTVGTIFLLQSSGQIYVYPPVYDSLANFKTWLASNPLQVIYPLATPQTYQLSPQEVALLTGTNNVWSDSGDITLEYGQLPNLLTNPTLFEASPLLEVEGYGNIDLNGFDISIENVVFGDIQVSEKAQNSAKLDITNCNSGDLLYAKVQSSSRILMGRWEDKITGRLGAKVQGQTGRSASLRYYGPYYVGTPWSEAWTSSTQSVTVEYDGTTYSAEVTISPTMTYDGNDTISIIIETTKTGTGADYIDVSITTEIYPFWCDSTKLILGHPTYIDCDLGEAYAIDNGVISSLNRYIALGSKLPTLAVGSSVITFDNTITDLKVTPRWWKI